MDITIKTESQQVTQNIRSDLFGSQRDDIYNHPIAAAKKETRLSNRQEICNNYKFCESL